MGSDSRLFCADPTQAFLRTVWLFVNTSSVLFHSKPVAQPTRFIITLAAVATAETTALHRICQLAPSKANLRAFAAFCLWSRQGVSACCGLSGCTATQSNCVLSQVEK